ncbi:DUF945 family protein [Vibrio maerlii]|uniref:DUF945 family protein n=1 Tax=Vibrio maerlii TaxID=2231648 RepID=UPI000E3ED5B4|nr:DUF945 family protein [Vibrio maerlii]
MQDLKKFGAIGGAISLALCWPLAVGHIGEKVIEDGIASLNDNEYMDSTIVEYDRGYLSSRVLTRYTITDPMLVDQLEQDGLPVAFDVVSDIKHGLMSLTSHSKIENLPEVPLSMTSVTQLNGNTSFDLMLDSWNINTEQQGAISIAPASIKGDLTVLGELAYQIDVPSIQVALNNGEKMELTNMKGEGEGKKEKGYWLGEQEVSVEKLVLTAPEPTESSELRDVSYRFSSTKSAEDTRINNHHLFSIDKLSSAGLSIENLIFDFSMNDIDSEAFENVMGVYQNSPVMTQEDIAELLPHVDALFARGFSLGLNQLSMVLDGGVFNSSWNIDIAEGTQSITQDPSTILPALSGQTEAFIGNKVVENNPSIRENLDELIILEMVEQSDDGYHLNVTMEQGNVRFSNGNEVPLISLLLPLFMGGM